MEDELYEEEGEGEMEFDSDDTEGRKKSKVYEEDDTPS